MFVYVLKRVVQGVTVALVVTLIVFFATRVFGDPARRMLPLSVTPEEYQAFVHRMGFDRAIHIQFVDFLGDLLRLDFGDSLWRAAPAADVVLARLPNTFKLFGAGMAIALVLALPLGAFAAFRPNSWLDRLISTLTLTWLSLPWFWVGAVLILVFAVRLQVLPTSGSETARHLVLPAVTLALPIAGRIAHVVRASLIEQLGMQYVVAARAKGLSERYIVVRHALRNMAVPVTSFVGWETISAFAGGMVIVEAVFSYPGVGNLTLEAVKRDDVILAQAAVLIVGLLIVFTTMLLDIVYTWIDPRIRLLR